MSAKPRIWSKFTVKSKDGQELNLRIQSITDDRKEECHELFKKYMIPQEAFQKAAEVTKNELALEEAEQAFDYMLGTCKVIVICCIDDGTELGGKILAASAMYLSKKNELVNLELLNQFKSQEMVKLISMVTDVAKMYNVSDRYGLENYYDGRGVVTHPDYRGIGLAQRLLHNRREICKEEGVALTGVLLTATGSQKAAERDGWETIFEIEYDELAKKYGVKFEGCPKMCKYMIARPL